MLVINRVACVALQHSLILFLAPIFLQFKHQPLSVQSGDLLNHDQEVIHNHDNTALHQFQEEEEEVSSCTPPAFMPVYI